MYGIKDWNTQMHASTLTQMYACLKVIDRRSEEKVLGKANGFNKIWKELREEA